MADNKTQTGVTLHQEKIPQLPRVLNWMTLTLGNRLLRWLFDDPTGPGEDTPIVDDFEPIERTSLPLLAAQRRFHAGYINLNRLCIDFGTAACAVAVATPIGPQVAPLDVQDDGLRYVIDSLFARKHVRENRFARGESTILLGNAAYDPVTLGQREGFTYYRSLKRMISDLRRSKLNEHGVTENITDMILELIFMGLAPAQSSTFLQQARDSKTPIAEYMKPLGLEALPLTRITAERPLTLFMTVPNAFGEFECSLVRKAGERALAAFHKWLWQERKEQSQQPPSEVRMLREADAVAWWELSQEPDDKTLDERWMIFDVGGGSTDVTVVSVKRGELTNPRILQLCHSGVTFGGNDVDELLLVSTALHAMEENADINRLEAFLKEQELDLPRHEILGKFRHRKVKGWSGPVEEALQRLAALSEQSPSDPVSKQTLAEHRRRFLELRQTHQALKATTEDETTDPRYPHFLQGLLSLHQDVVGAQPDQVSVGMLLQQIHLRLNAIQISTDDRKQEQRQQWQGWIKWLADGANLREKPPIDALEDEFGIRPFEGGSGDKFWNRGRIGNVAANNFSEFADAYGTFLRAVVCGVVDDIMQFEAIGPEQKLDRVILSGRAARLPGITELLTHYLVHKVKVIPDPAEIRARARTPEEHERLDALALRTIGPVRPDALIRGEDRDRMKLACVRGTAIAADRAIQSIRLGDTVSEDISYKIGNSRIPLWIRGNRLLARAEAQALIELPRNTFEGGMAMLKFQQHRFPQKIAQIFPGPRNHWQFRHIRSIPVPMHAPQRLKVHFDHGAWTLQCWGLIKVDEDRFEAVLFPGDDDGMDITQINPVTKLSFGWADGEQV